MGKYGISFMCFSSIKSFIEMYNWKICGSWHNLKFRTFLDSPSQLLYNLEIVEELLQNDTDKRITRNR